MRKPGGPLPHLGSGTHVPTATGVRRCSGGRVCVDRHRQVCAGVFPIRLALTAGILSVWLTCRPRLRAPTAEMRLLLQQKGMCMVLPCKQLCRARLPPGSWLELLVQPPGPASCTRQGPWAGQCVKASSEASVFKIAQQTHLECYSPHLLHQLLLPGPQHSAGAPTHPAPAGTPFLSP